jgi:hypothetical protein
MLEETGKGIYLNLAHLEVYFHGGVNFEPYREIHKNTSQKKI